MKSLFVVMVCGLAFAVDALAQGSPGASKPAAGAAPAADHLKKDIARHRAMAQAHEAAAQCLEAGKSEDSCLQALQASCKGLAIGKYCGMRHEH